MLHSTPPPGFTPRFTIVGGCLEAHGKILILKRAAHKPQGKMWGLPAGKANPGESLEETAVREVWEETGVVLESGSLRDPRVWYVVLPYISFVWVVFTIQLTETPVVTLHDDEHVDYGWFTPVELLGKELIDDLPETIMELYDVRN